MRFRALATIAILVVFAGDSLSTQGPAVPPDECVAEAAHGAAAIERRQAAVAATPAAFLARVELARCYDLAWRLDAVENAIADAIGVLRNESLPVSAGTPPTGPLLAGTDVAIPARTRSDPAKYPDQASSDNITGLVIVETTIDTQGRVRKAEIARSVSRLDDAALRAVKAWRFAPSVVNGKVVEVLTYLPIKFGQSSELWASDYLDLASFYYERGLWRHAATVMEVARTSARKDADRYGRVIVPPKGDAKFAWPAVVKDSKPKYTSAAMRAKIQGRVELRLLVDRTGAVGRVSVTKPLEMLNLAAQQAAVQWKFSPGRLNGEPVSVIVGLVLEFRVH